MNVPIDTRLVRADLVVLDPRVIQHRVGRLMRAYLRTGSANLARAVVRHLEALCGHPRLDAGHEERCVYRRLTRQWRLLAEQDAVPIASAMMPITARNASAGAPESRTSC